MCDTVGEATMAGHTKVAIDGDAWLINGTPTYEGREYRGWKIEGLLLNSRMVNAVFDDDNEHTRVLWAYPDTGRWDADRNTDEFVAMLPAYRAHGLMAVTVNLQGGAPLGYYRSDAASLSDKQLIDELAGNDPAKRKIVAEMIGADCEDGG